MPTTKHRINMTADKEVQKALASAAKRDGVSVSSKVAELVSIGLALEEDVQLAAVATSRLASKGRYVPHDTVWK